METKSQFHDILKQKMDLYAHEIYRITKDFPKSELYGLVSQIRRSSVSVVLNYIEGFARIKQKVYINFLEISYGSLKETQYLLVFSYKESLIKETDFNKINALGDEIGAMLWSIMKNVKSELV
jgi:four helix bundle protein